MLTQCKNCSARVNVPESAVGKRLRCPICETQIESSEVLPVAECEHCWFEFKVRLEFLGKRLKCTQCEKVTTIKPRSPRMEVWCETCNDNVSVPQAIRGWTFNCSQCKSTLKAIERKEAEFLERSSENDYLVVKHVEELTSDSSIIVQRDKVPNPADLSKRATEQKEKQKLARGMERGISRRKEFLTGEISLQNSSANLRAKKLPPHASLPFLHPEQSNAAHDLLAGPPARKKSTPVARPANKIAAPRILPAGSEESNLTFKKRRKSKLEDTIVIIVAATVALVVTIGGGMVVWHYLASTRGPVPKSAPRLNFFEGIESSNATDSHIENNEVLNQAK